MKRFLPHILFVLLVAGVALASSIKSWSAGENVLNSDLNSNFSHVHTQAEALVTNAKVSSGAAIAHSKLATPALVPKAWGRVTAACSSDPCTLTAGSGISVVHYVSAGVYTVTLSTARGGAAVYMATVTAEDASNPRACRVTGYASATVFNISCHDLATPTAANSGFNFVVFDDDN